MRARVWMAACLAVLLAAAGCQTPLQVREAQAWEQMAFQNYVRNADRIIELQVMIYKDARTRDIDYTTEKAIALVKGKAVGGQLPVDQVEAAIRAIMANRDRAVRDTDAIVARIKALQAQNAQEAQKALRIHGKIAEWMEAGVESSAVPKMIQDVVDVIKAASGGTTLP